MTPPPWLAAVYIAVCALASLALVAILRCAERVLCPRCRRRDGLAVEEWVDCIVFRCDSCRYRWQIVKTDHDQ